MAVEIKRSSAPALSRGFHSARQQLNAKQAYLVHGGQWLGDFVYINIISLYDFTCENYSPPFGSLWPTSRLPL